MLQEIVMVDDYSDKGIFIHLFSGSRNNIDKCYFAINSRCNLYHFSIDPFDFCKVDFYFIFYDCIGCKVHLIMYILNYVNLCYKSK